MSYLLSIVIPTKDRYPYLFELLRLVDSFKSDEIEVVLQDNTDDNSPILEHLNQHPEFTFVNYNYTHGQIPVSLNCDKAILNSHGEYICFIGDDDGVTSYILDCVKWMKDNNVECVLPQVIGYQWPDFISAMGTAGGKLSYKDIDGSFVKKNSMDELYSLMNKGLTYRGGLPLAYQAIVKRSTLDKIYGKCNTFFPGPSPDLANAVALCLVMDSFYYVNLPITISGASKTHGGGVRKMKNRMAKIEDVPFLPQNTKDEWEPRIPKVWAGETIWPESAIKAMRRMGRPDLVDQVNFDSLYTSFITFHYGSRRLALELTDNKFKVLKASWIYMCKRYFWAARRMFYSKMLHKEYGVNSIYGVKNIFEAAYKIENAYKDLLEKTFRE